MVREITLQNGFKCSIDDQRLDDMELLEDLVEVDEGNVMKLPAIIDKILGVAQKKKLYNKLRDKKTGTVSSIAVAEALQEIMESMGEVDAEDTAKNS